MDIRFLIHDLKVLSTLMQKGEGVVKLSSNLREILEYSCCYVAAYTLQSISLHDLAAILSIGDFDHNFNSKSSKKLILYLMLHLKSYIDEGIYEFPDSTVNLYLEKLVERIKDEFSPIEWVKLEQEHRTLDIF